MITVERTSLDGVCLIKPRVFEDQRGFFMETFNRRDFESENLPTEFVQDNHSRSSYGVLRGLHYQNPTWQGKLVRAVVGEIFDVAVDIRKESTTFGQWFGATLSAGNKHQLYVPEGYAHGFCVVSDVAEVLYKCTTPYAPHDEGSVLWNDPDIGIDWPVESPVVSEKDAKAKRLKDIVL